MTGQSNLKKRRSEDDSNKNRKLEHFTISELLTDHRQNKKTKTKHTKPIVYAKLRVAKGEIKTVACLLDSGAEETCINKKLVKKFRKVKTEPTVWTTTAGHLKTRHKVKAHFSLTEFYKKKIIKWNCHAFENTCKYDLIIG